MLAHHLKWTPPEEEDLSDSLDSGLDDYRELRVVLLSGTLRLSGSSTWIIAMQGALRRVGCPVVHIVVGQRSEVEPPADYAVHYTGRARRHPLLRICRLLQVHKLLPDWFERQCDRVIGHRIDRVLDDCGWRQRVDLVIKDFTSDVPGCLQRTRLVSVIHQMLSTLAPAPALKNRVLPSFILAAVSHATAEDARGLGLEVDRVLYNPLDAVVLRDKAAAFEVQGDYLLFVGSLHRDKGVYQLLEAYALVGLTQALWFVGSGEERVGLEARARALGIAERVHFTGFCTNPYPYLAQAQLLVLPSVSEGMPYVCLEAVALETPFLVSDFTAAQEFFEPQVRVPLQPAADFVERLAKRMVEMLEHPGPPGLKAGLLQQLAPEVVARSYLALL